MTRGIRPVRLPRVFALVAVARALFAAALLALSGALALPAAAQTPDPVWSTVMTVGTTGYGGHGYDVDEDEGGSLTDDDFEYSSATYTVTDVELDVFFGVSFGVLEEGLPEEDTLTLEIDGHAFPFEDRTPEEGGSTLWVWAVPTGLDADDNADLPIGSQVGVCLRTATQVCPTTEVPSALSVKDVSAEEGEDLTFTVALSPPSTETVTVDWATSGGTATSGTDFTAGTGTLTFTAGVTEQTFTVATIEDVTDQRNETFTVTLSNATNATISGATATGTIKDDDAPPLVAWSTVMTVAEVFGDPSHGYSENNGGELADADFQYDSATYTVEGIYVTRFGDVSFRVDKSGLPQDEILTLVIDGHEFPFEDRRDNSGASLWKWAVPEGLNDPVNDLPVGESVVVCLRNGTGVCPARALTVTDVSAEEGEDLTFTATLWQASTETVTVDWATSEGTATSGTDFTAGTETLTFTAGVTEQTVTVATIEDMTDEDHETFTVTLSNPTSGTITGAPATGIIVDDDGTSPLWSATMTVGDTQIGGHGYQEKGRGGLLSDDDFAYGLTATTYTTYVVEAVLVDADFGVSFLVDIDPAGVPLDNTLTLEIGGHEFPVEDRNAFSSSTFLYWAVPAALDDLETEFPVGSTATVCLRTATQVCPTGSIVTPTTDPVWSTTMTAGDTPLGHGYDRTDLDAPTIGALDDDNFDYGSSSYGVLALDVATNAVRFVVAESGLPTNEILTLELGGHALAFSDRHNAISGQSRWYWTVPAALDDLETEFPVGSTATVCLRTATQVCPTGRIVTPPTLPTLSIADAEATEGSPVTFTATLSATATADVMATWTASIESGDTAGPADLGTTTTGPVMVTAGQTTGTFMVPTAPDATNEGNETFTVTLSSVSSNAQLAADATATGTIVNDDQPTVGFKEERVIVLEGAAIISFLVELDEASTVPITVDWETRAGSAEADVDYTAASGTLTFAAGDTEETITVALIDDAIHEENVEEFTVHLSGTDDALVTLGRSSVLGRIIDRDRATITVAEETTVDEDAGTVTLTLTASASASAAYMIDYATENGTAEAGTDYTAASGQVTFPAGVTEQTITITVLDDAADEDREDFKVRLSNATAQRIDLPADPARVLIEDNDDPPTVTVADGTATEGDKVEFTVTLSALSGLDVEVDYATTETDPQSAVSGTDFTAASGTLEIEAGNRTGTIEVQTTEDDASESAETFTLTISNPDNATLGAKVAATGTINDDANAAPAFSSSAAFDAAENQFDAGTVLATDGDTGDDVTGYAITGGADQTFFLSVENGLLLFQDVPNYEDAQDQGSNNTYVVEVTATSGTGTREKTATQTITVTVTDVSGEAPGKPAAPDVAAASVTSLTVSWSAPANAGPAITDYDVQYREGTSGSWTDGGHDGTATTATLSGLSENTSYQVQVRATNDEGTGDWSDSGSGTTDANAAPAFSSSATFDAAENQTAAGTVLATDGDTGDDVTGYAITGGADQAFFSIGATSGALTFDDAPNFEDAKDTDTNNTYVVEVQATSGTDTRVKTATQAITVTVTDVAGEKPGKPAAPDVAAASVTSLTVTWTKPANAGPAITDYDVQYREGTSGSWSDGNHTGTAVTATLSSLSENTSYQVQVRATNDEGTGSWSDSGTGTTDANAAPAFSSSATFDAAENQTAAGTVLAADSDTDDDITGYAITGGADQAFFSIGTTSGALTFDDAPNFEDAEDQGTNNTYVVEVTATSGMGEREKTATQTITVTVTDVAGEAPGKPAAPDVAAASVSSLTVSWSAPDNAGPAIDDYDVRYRAGTTGDWSDGNHVGTATTATLSGLSENTSYQVQVRATNDEGTGSWSDSGTGTTDANAAPTFSSSAAFDAAENQTAAGTVLATDGDTGDDITGYAITGGADQAFFSIGATSGALTFDAAPNFEDAKDSDTDNEYEVTVQATSGTDTRVKTATQTITVTVTDVSGEAPGKPAAPTVSAASVTSLTVTWSAPANAGPAITDYDVQYREGTGGSWSDGGHTGAALTATLTGLSENTSYDVQVRATNDEGTGDWSDSGTGTTDANAAPAFTSSATFDAAENQTAAGTVVATDGDTGDDITGYEITGGADETLFEIGMTDGALTFKTAPNFEDAKDQGTNNTYVVEVTATSGMGEREKTATQTITVTVTDVAGEAPGKPNAPDVAAASVTSLTVNWSAPSNAGPAITDYDVQYREGTSGSWTDGNHTGTAVTATLSSLSEGTSYQVQVRATNDEGTGDWSDSGSGTTDANAAPTFSSSSTFDAAENQTSAGTVLATDSDSEDDVTGYAITGGADQNLFSIGATSGALTFDDAPNFEDAKDQGTNNTYVVEVTATSGMGEREKTATQTITVTVTDVSGEAPGKPAAPTVSAASVTSLTVNWTAPANAGPAITDYDYRHRTTSPQGTWTEVTGTTITTLSATIGSLAENTSYDVQVRATNDEGTGSWSDSGTGTTDANAAPTFSSSAAFDAAENQTAAGTVLATDGDTGDDITGYAITGGADQAFFSIGATSGALTFDAAPNFEDAKDSDTDNEYEVTVQATSGTDTRVKTATQTITVTVTDVSGEAPGKPAAPTVSAASVTSLTVTWSAPANAGPAITDYDVQYREGTGGSWSDGGHTGAALTATLTGLSENTSYDVQVRATNDEGTGDWSDSGTGTTDANAAPAFTSSATFDAAENQTTAGTVLAADSDAGDDITGYAITGGADQAFFSVVPATGVLTFQSAPNFEDAKDTDTNNTYVVEVQATSGTDTRVKTATQAITVTVTDVSGEAPGKPAAPTVAAASVTSLTVNWSAPANAGPAITDYDVQYREGTGGSWSDGGHTGAALTATLTGLSENTSYDVQVRATNDEGTGDWSDSGTGTTDANAAPAFTSSATFDAAENQTTAGTVLAADSDAGDDITGYAITGGADQAFFSVVPATGVLTFQSAPNFEDAKDTDTNNTYVVEVQATSGTDTRVKTATQAITVTVTDVSGEAPGKPAAPTVAAASVTSLTVTWTKPANAGPAITDYDVQYREGTTGSWTDGNHTGAALTATLSSLSENTSYQVQVRATNDEGTGSWSDSGTGTTDANAAPSFSSSAAFDAAENQTAAGTVLATDGDTDDDITGYEITGGADQSFFSIGATSGALTFDDAPNFEDAEDQGTNNTYVVTVEATSGTGTREKTATQTITVTVTDVGGEAPGKPAAPTVSAASVTSLTVTWSAPANAGPAITDYDVQYRAGTSGSWSDGNHTGTAVTATLSGLSENTSYQVQVRATNDEGTGDWSDAGSGRTDANAAPAFSSSATFGAAENQTAAGTVLATDGDTDDDITGYEITGGADQSFFSIGATSGALTFDDAPNFEDAQDQGTNNTYVVTVEATSGTGTREKTATQTITVTVTDVSGEKPAAPAAPDVAAASVTSLTVNWTAPANAGPAITDYDYRHRTTSPQGTWTEVTGTTITTLSATIGSLAENTSYDVQVRATNDEGTGSWSDSGTGTTDANAAPTFSSSATFDAAENQTTAGTVLATDGDTEDDITGYAITGGADEALFEIGMTDGALTFKTAPNYEDAKDHGTDNTYVVEVTATSGMDTREKTATQTITVTVTDVAGEAPGKPNAPDVAAASVTSLTVSWSAPANAGPAIDDYDVRYREGTTGDWSDGNHTGTATTATLSSLAENTSYQVQVRATNDEGTGSWSDAGSGATDAEPEEEAPEPENQPSEIRAYWTDSDTRGSNVQEECDSTEPFRAFWNPPKSNGSFKVADEWEAEVEPDPRYGASNVSFTIQNTGGDRTEPKLTGTVDIDGFSVLSIRVHGRFGDDGWGAWSPITELFCRTSAAKKPPGLASNVPNPFNPSTVIPYRLDTDGPVRLEIYNLLGQRIRTLVNEVQAAGPYRVRWDARDATGRSVATGIYFTRLHHPGGVHIRRMLYLK